MAAAVIQFESQRIGLENDNDLIYYTFSAGYNLKPHRFQFDVVYLRDRWAGADLAMPRVAPRRTGIGFQGQETDSVLLMASWTGQLGPVRALLQANGVVGRAHGGTAGLPGSRRPYRSGSMTSWLGQRSPMLKWTWGSCGRLWRGHWLRPIATRRDRELHGFAPASWQDVTQITGAGGLITSIPVRTLPGGTMRVRRGCRGCGRQQPLPQAPWRLGRRVSAGSPAGFECSHSVSNPFNQRLGNLSHLGISRPTPTLGPWWWPRGCGSSR